MSGHAYCEAVAGPNGEVTFVPCAMNPPPTTFMRLMKLERDNAELLAAARKAQVFMVEKFNRSHLEAPETHAGDVFYALCAAIAKASKEVQP